MRKLRVTMLCAACMPGILCGCQHVPPEPLDLSAVHTALNERELDIEPIRLFADALAQPGDDGQPFNAADGLTIQEGQAVALWYNPDVRTARLHAARAGASAEAAGLWPDPEVSVAGGQKKTTSTDIESVDPTTGRIHDAREIDRSWISITSLSVTIPLSGRVRAAKELFESEHDIARLRMIETEWDTWTRVAIAWAEWSAAVSRVQLLDEHRSLLGQLAETADALAGVGELSPPSARLFAIEHYRVEAESHRAAATEHEARVALLHLLGLLHDAPVALVPTLEPVPPEPARGPEDHPRIARLRAQYQAAEDRLRLELRKQYPDITLAPTYTDEQDETSITLGLGFPVPVWNANRRGIAEAAANRDVARAEVIAEYQALLAESAQAHAAFEGSRAQREGLAETVAPAVDAQLEESLALLEIGELDIVLLYESVVQAWLVKQQILDATLEHVKAAYRLAAATASGPIANVPSTETHP